MKIENRRLDWNSVGARTVNLNPTYRRGGGDVKIHDEKVNIEVGSRIGSLANVKHRPGGGDKKIFDDKEYTRQMLELSSGAAAGLTRSGSSSLTGSTWDSLDQGTGTLPRGKRSVTAPGSSFQSQIVRKLSPMSTGF